MRCIVGLSGGVDSAVSSAIMKSKGFEVIGCVLKMFESSKTEASIKDAHEIADFLEIPISVIDCTTDFKHRVTDYFIDSYENGLTPNPCVMCNKFVKFQYLDDFRKKHNAELLVTGHYAKLRKSEGGVDLLQAEDLSKDQSYFLYRINSEILKHTEFPLGEYSKSQTREQAKRLGLFVCDKSDSQDICFLENGGYTSFLKSSREVIGGDIVDENGKILGEHKGIIHYTVGQRKGLGLSNGPYFVSRLDVDKNLVIVSNKDTSKTKTISLACVKFINGEFLGNCEVKIRSANKKISGTIIKEAESYFVKLNQPEYAAPGQHCVFYNKNLVLGGGIIC